MLTLENALQILVGYSNLMHKPIALLPATDYGAEPIERLERFYLKNGFVKNKELTR